MNFTCVICSDQITPSGNVYVTQCGHIFHYICLISWIKRSETCPQCRTRTRERDIHKVFFNLTNTDTTQDDTATLQYKLDKANSQMKLQDQEIKNYNEKYKKAKSEIVALRETFAVSENTLRLAHALNGQLSFANNIASQFSDELTKSLLDAERRKHDSDEKAKQLMYEASHNKRECNRLQTENTKLQYNLAKLKEDFEYAENQWKKEMNYMREKLIERDNNHATGSANTSLKRIVPLPKRLNPVNAEIAEEMGSPSPDEAVGNILESDSPYLPVKASSSSLGYSSTHSSQIAAGPGTSKDSIFKPNPAKDTDIKRPKQDDSYCYNELGGTSKIEILPSPNKQLAGLKRVRPQTITSAEFKKLAPKAQQEKSMNS